MRTMCGWSRPISVAGSAASCVVYSDPVLAAMAAKQLKRPVKVALTRPQIYNHTTHRPATIQHLQLGADKDGKLRRHRPRYLERRPGGRRGGNGVRTDQTALCAAKTACIRTRLTVLTCRRAASMRAPGEAVGLLALEGAMDELAEKLDMDPVELRIRNDIQPRSRTRARTPVFIAQACRVPEDGRRTFGWDKRQASPGQVRDGRWLVGMGVASAIRNNLLQPSGARVTADAARHAWSSRRSMTDIGTGSYTMLAQVGGRNAGPAAGKGRMSRLGDSDFPAGRRFGRIIRRQQLRLGCLLRLRGPARRTCLQGRVQLRQTCRFEDGKVACGRAMPAAGRPYQGARISRQPTRRHSAT